MTTILSSAWFTTASLARLLPRSYNARRYPINAHRETTEARQREIVASWRREGFGGQQREIVTNQQWESFASRPCERVRSQPFEGITSQQREIVTSQPHRIAS